MCLALALWSIMGAVLGLALYLTPTVPQPAPLNVEWTSEEPWTYQHGEVRCPSTRPPVANELCARGRWGQAL